MHAKVAAPACLRAALLDAKPIKGSAVDTAARAAGEETGREQIEVVVGADDEVEGPGGEELVRPSISRNPRSAPRDEVFLGPQLGRQ